jgi:cytoskeletal protein RodZ
MSGANSKAMPGLGDEFRAAREARHLSLSDVSEQIHIRSVYLQCIESEDWSSIAAPVYVRGFVRTYARFLGLDAESAVERVNALMGEAAAKPAEPVPVKAAKPVRVREPGAKGSPSPWLWLALGAAVAVLGYVGYQFVAYQASGGSSGVAADASPAAGPQAAAPAPAGSAGTVAAAPTPKPEKPTSTLVVSITQTSWLLVKVDGAQIIEGIFPPGTIKKFHGKSAVIRAGNAGGVDLTVNGKDLGPLGASGSVVDKTVQLAEE